VRTSKGVFSAPSGTQLPFGVKISDQGLIHQLIFQIDNCRQYSIKYRNKITILSEKITQLTNFISKVEYQMRFPSGG
jgi:hypothetical protein